MKVQCANCGHECDSDEAEIASDLYDRHEVGVIYSDLECPEEGCGALMYPVDPKLSYPWFDADAAKVQLRKFLAWIEANKAETSFPEWVAKTREILDIAPPEPAPEEVTPEGMTKFVLIQRRDAYINYRAEVFATSADEAAKMSDKVRWEEDDSTEFDAFYIDVWNEDESEQLIEGTD